LWEIKRKVKGEEVLVKGTTRLLVLRETGHKMKDCWTRKNNKEEKQDGNKKTNVVSNKSGLKEHLANTLQPKSNDVYVEATQDVKSDDADDLALKKGDQLLVLDMSDTDGWWEGRKLSNNTTGFFPSNFVKIIKAPTRKKSTTLIAPI